MNITNKELRAAISVLINRIQKLSPVDKEDLYDLVLDIQDSSIDLNQLIDGIIEILEIKE